MTATVLGFVVLAGGWVGRSTASQASTPGRDSGTPVLSVTLEGREFKWNPTTVTVRAGQRVRLRIANKGTIDHSFVSGLVRAPKAQEIAPGRETTVEWTIPPRGGSFEFWCDIPGHREAGMAGTILVK
jgi:uncharacterized cupredoxin-like copper-binding protein